MGGRPGNGDGTQWHQMTAFGPRDGRIFDDIAFFGYLSEPIKFCGRPGHSRSNLLDQIVRAFLCDGRRVQVMLAADRNKTVADECAPTTDIGESKRVDAK